MSARGYAENASELIRRYEAISFPEKHEALLALIPVRCSVNHDGVFDRWSE